MSAFPRSFKDPEYDALDAKTSEKLGLPSGLLAAVRLRGERSNHDQVSDAGASTVYQIIPATRKAAIDKYGIDPMLSPQNASEVAGRLLKDSLERNKGDASLAVAEYIGGTDRRNWGPTTKAYVKRVVGRDAPTGEATSAPAAPAAPSGGSTFQRALAAQPTAVSGPQIAQVFQAYQSGQMTPEEAKEFEADVNSGAVLLPRGAQLKTQATTQQATAQPLPDGVAAAYFSGQMPAEDRAQLDADVAAGLVQAPQRVEIPAAVPAGTVTPAATVPMVDQRDTTLAEKIVGAGESALQVATSATGGTLGTAGGAIGSTAAAILSGQFGTKEAADAVEKAAAEGGQALTYAPRTVSGQQQSQAIGEVMQQAVPITGLTGEMQAMAAGARPLIQAPRAAATTIARNAVEAVPAPVVDAAKSVASGAKQAAAVVTAPISSVTGKVRKALGSSNSGEMAGRSVGAAETGAANVRRANAQDLPEPINLTEGQATRNMEQQRFERETAKNPEQGAPLRERFEQQNEQILQNFDHFVDSTGAKTPTDLRATGVTVDSALKKQYEAGKKEVNAAYNRARNSDEANRAVDQNAAVSIGEGDTALTSTPFQFLNEQPAGLPNTAVADAARQYAVRLGIAEMKDDQLVPRPTTVAKLEDWRKAIGEAIGYEPTDIRTGTILKKLIDGQTEPVAGPLYRQARATRQRLAQNFEDRAVINRLMSKKRGTEDRAVALEDVFSHSVLDGSLDDVREVRRVLHRGGGEGRQAWNELQGATLNHIREEMTKNVARDSKGNPIVSAAALDRVIRKLDSDGKLDVVFGKAGAEKLRVVNDVAKDVLVSVPGAVNHSNTASVLLAALDMGMSGAAGLPLPVASGLRLLANNIKDRKLAARVRESLGKSEKTTEKF